MANLKYVEPGTYVSTESTKKKTSAAKTVEMCPLLIGRIPEYIPKSVTVVRTGDQYDYLPVECGNIPLNRIKSIRSTNFLQKAYSLDETCFSIEYSESNNCSRIKWNDVTALTEIRAYWRWEPVFEKPDDWDENWHLYYAIPMNDLANSSYRDTNIVGGIQWYSNDYNIVKNMLDLSDNGKIQGHDFYNDLHGWQIVKEYSDDTPIKDRYYEVLVRKHTNSIQHETTEIKSLTPTDANDWQNKGIELEWIDGESISTITYPCNYSISKEDWNYDSCPFDYVIYNYASVLNIDELNVPAVGSAYTVSFEYKPNDNEECYKLREFNKAEDVARLYGSDTTEVDYDENGVGFNPLPTAAAILEESGIKTFFTLGINTPATGDNIDYSEYYAKALGENCIGIEGERIYRIIPLDQDEKIAKVIRNHVNEFSSDEERMECSGVVSIPYSPSKHVSYENYINDVTEAALLYDSSRMILSFGGADRTLSDGRVVHLSTQYLLTYIIGVEGTKTDGTGLTNITIPSKVFTNLDIPIMRRSVKNNIASAGVLIFEQKPVSDNIKIRHALTTRTSDSYGSEMSVQYNIDYTRKYLRHICSPYIGQRNINSEVLELIEETLQEGLSALVEEGKLTKGIIEQIGVSEDSQDTIVVVLKVAVAYPLNYVYITLVLDN